MAGGRRPVAHALVAAVVVVAGMVLAGCSLLGGLLPPGPLLTREQAIAAARVAEPDWADEGVLVAQLMTWADFESPPVRVDGPAPDPLDPVWLVNLGFQDGPLYGQGVILFIDARDGHVIGRSSWIS